MEHKVENLTLLLGPEQLRGMCNKTGTSVRKNEKKKKKVENRFESSHVVGLKPQKELEGAELKMSRFSLESDQDGQDQESIQRNRG